MALIKVKLRIKSVIKGADDPTPEITDEECLGVMRCAAGGAAERISYKITGEDGNKTETAIELFDGAVRLLRHGAIESNMLFEVGVEHRSLYKIPPFSFDLTVNTSRIENSFSSLGGTLTLEYSMTVGGAERKCSMTVTAEPI